MFIDMNGVEIMQGYLGEGKHLVKIVGIEPGDGYVTIKFQAKSGMIHSERFYLDEKRKWRLGLLAKACNVWKEGEKGFDARDLLGCYLYVDIKRESYVNNMGQTKEYTTAKYFEESKLGRDESMAKMASEQPTGSAETLDVGDDDIPF